MHCIHNRASRGLLTALCLGLVAACDSSSSSSRMLTECSAALPAACYNVTFTGLWNSVDHPTSFPAGAHFSPMTGGTHNANVTFWMTGGFASPGIEQMAETGGTGILRNEVNAAITNLDAQSVIQGSGIDAEGAVILSFTVTPDYPLLTLTSMIAPSPDWFVGVDSVPLRENDAWLERIERELHSYDAGTDDGVTFTSTNADSDPQDAIERILTAPLAAPIAPLGRIVIERVF